MTGFWNKITGTTDSKQNWNRLKCPVACFAQRETIVGALSSLLQYPSPARRPSDDYWWWKVTEANEFAGVLCAEVDAIKGKQVDFGKLRIRWFVNSGVLPGSFEVVIEWLADRPSSKMAQAEAERFITLTEDTLVQLNISHRASSPQSSQAPQSLMARFGKKATQSGSARPTLEPNPRRRHSPEPVRPKQAWPTPQDYHEAMQNPQCSLTDESIKFGWTELSSLGLPRVATGAFASVYRLTCNEKDWAIRCFLQPVKDQHYRYDAIGRFVRQDNLPYTVWFEFQHEGIRTPAGLCPVLKMEWVDGIPLHVYVESIIGDTEKLSNLIQKFRQMSNDLHASGIAHGDLQHGNILVRQDELVLVDYDGMYVPELFGRPASEIGHRNYQHPCRNEFHFGDYLDNFAFWVIDLSLLALMLEPRLWMDFAGGDECLILRKTDFLNPSNSQLFETLLTHNSFELKDRAEFFLAQLQSNVEEVPALAKDGNPLFSSATVLSDG